MDDEHLQRLLRGYQLPEPPRALDLRVMEQAERILNQARARAAAATVARELGNAFGFGYINYLIDLVTTTDAEYHIDLI